MCCAFAPFVRRKPASDSNRGGTSAVPRDAQVGVIGHPLGDRPSFRPRVERAPVQTVPSTSHELSAIAECGKGEECSDDHDDHGHESETLRSNTSESNFVCDLPVGEATPSGGKPMATYATGEGPLEFIADTGTSFFIVPEEDLTTRMRKKVTKLNLSLIHI